MEITSRAGGGTMPVPNGTSRLLLQTGPNRHVFSNWINLETVPSRDASKWKIIATEQLTPGNDGIYEFLLGGTPSGKWLFLRPIWKRSLLKRICPLPAGETPRIKGDPSRRQAAIIFEKHPEETIYFSALLGISRKKPWPVGCRGCDFNLKPVPIDAPSPMGFPLELFDQPVDPSSTAATVSNPADSAHTAAPRTARPGNPRHAEDAPDGTAKNTWWWPVPAAILLLLAAILGVLLKNRKPKT
jgi:hypothetical protein